ncbi:WxL domain-containing protein [Lacticaseibacillus porcinae]|uniref:WxL domain-containing protein n=1 Tax=Lacticaseibacillus porcinae TaxID=1123687 RepID=UPI000F78961F|nr:WxL domain-containing protein [Lacticaseibacillus porcinae]
MKHWMIGLLLLIGLWPNQPVSAADPTDVGPAMPAVVVDGNATATSTAQVDVVAQTLALVQVPDLRFQAVKVKDLIQGPQTLAMVSGSVTKDGEGPGFDGDDQEQIVVEDFRGTNSGWQLLVKLDAFQLADSSTTLMPMQASFAPTNAIGTNASGMTLSATDFADNDAPVVVAPMNRGTGTTTIQIATASLTLPQTKSVLAGDYRAPLNWLLVSGPQP